MSRRQNGVMERTAPQARRFSPATRRRVARTLIAALVLALLWSAAFLYGPPIIRGQAEKMASEALGRPVSIGAVAFNPWTLATTLTDLVVGGKDSAQAQAQARIKRLHADVALASLFRLAPVIDRLEIDAPWLRMARRADGGLDVDDIVQRLVERSSASSDEPARFALHNIVVSQGSADVADATVGMKHVLRDLELALPFISSLPSEREIKVEPRLAFVLDGSRFDSAAAATPYSATGAGEATLRLVGLDVAPWLAYLPKSAPVRLTAASLSADLRLAFEQRPKLSLRISGSAEISRLAVVDAAAGALLDVGSIKVVIDELRPLERTARLRRVEVDAPRLLAARNAAGRINLMLEGVGPGGTATPVAALPVPTSAASAAKAAPLAPQWKVVLGELSLRAGSLDWRDAGVTPAAALALNDFSFTATALQWPLDAPVVFKSEGTLAGAGGRGRLALSGQGNGAGARVQVGVDAVPLSIAAPYLRAFLVPSLAGNLDADVRVDWRPGGDAPRFDIQATRVAVESLRLGDTKSPELAADRIEVASARIDTAARSVAIGRLALQAPRVRLERDRERRWNFERWQAAAPASAAAATAGTRAGWSVGVDELVLDKGRIGFADRALDVPVALDVSELAVQLRNFAVDGAGAAPFSVQARIAVPAGPTGAAVGSGFAGSVEARGELARFASGLPAAAKAALQLKNLPLHLLDPYLDEVLQVDVQKAQTSFTGNVAYESGAGGPRLSLTGDAVIDDFRADSPFAGSGGPQRALAMLREDTDGRRLLSWKTLTMRGIEFAVAPGEATRLAVAETAASDLFARIVLDEAGRINLKDVARPAPVSASASGAASAAASGAAPPPVVRFGPIGIVNSRVAFDDRFVKPNYSANLSELRGRLGSFSSVGAAAGQPPLLAELELKGRVEGTASLEITGKLNPLAKPLALDIAAKVRDLELPPLSPYAIKYAGYGIERGKMSVDVNYVVKPDGQLTATNKIVLNQLVFGDKVDGAPASLPVKFATALLADRNGVIDLDLPVGGSINDPQFSIGGLIWKALGTLIVKAVTSPFSLLASGLGGGGGTELSQVAFLPGSSALDAAAKEGLDKVAKALLERPALTLTVNGESRLENEREAWKAERLRQLVRSEKRRQAIAAGAGATDAVLVAESEVPGLLTEVYRRADIVKPKNALGLARDLKTSEMEPLLLASITVPDDAMQQLAVRRAVVVRDYLATKELPTSRLFLGAPKTGGGADAAAWSPRVELKLAMN